MLYRNDIFLLDGTRVRLLSVNAATDVAWVLSLDEPCSMPESLPYSEIQDLPGEQSDDVSLLKPSPAQVRRLEAAWDRLAPLLEAHGEALYAAVGRKALITAYAKQVGCSPTTIYQALRRYWRHGQTKQALMPDCHRCGRPRAKGSDDVTITAGRGRKPLQGSIYQVTGQDENSFHQVIRREYLKDGRKTAVDAYTVLLAERFCYIDGNGGKFLLPPGERPSMRQFRRFLKAHYDIETRLRSREGDKDFEREHRKVLGTYLADCEGVGHYYEIDATIADVYLVASEDPTKIIGKPTIYTVVDRKSSLIVGVYCGLEHASWLGARQAILSITEDKRALCERYGVAYDPADWPAHGVFPQAFVGDRGEMISKASNKLVDGLGITIINPPSQRPDWKPVVECGFRQLHSQMRPIAPAYDPPSNAMRRRGKHYEKDASLTLAAFGNLLLNAVIAHNRKEMPGYQLSNRELLDEVSPAPVALWEHGIRTRSGVLTRYSEATVRFALLPDADAVVTEKGIEFKGCFYSSPEAISEKWFERARVTRFKARVSYDPRLADSIYIHPLSGTGAPFVATLSERSREYRGLSFGEVAYYESLRAAVRQEADHSRLQNSIDYHAAVAPTLAAAKKKRKAMGKKVSRSARRSDTVEARSAERTLERQQLAAIQGGKPTTAPSPATGPTAVPLRPSTSPPGQGKAASTLDPKFDSIYQQMLQ